MICVLSLTYSTSALSGYKTFLDPRSMAMGGTGVASATKFNASAHNPALIAFNRGNKPDKIHISTNTGLRQLYGEKLNADVLEFQNSSLQSDFLEAINEKDLADIRETGDKYSAFLKEKDMSSYRSDETLLQCTRRYRPYYNQLLYSPRNPRDECDFGQR